MLQQLLPEIRRSACHTCACAKKRCSEGSSHSFIYFVDSCALRQQRKLPALKHELRDATLSQLRSNEIKEKTWQEIFFDHPLS
jgi:hypothetical protein